MSETSTTVESTMACSEEHKIVESPDVQVSEYNEYVDEQNAEVTKALIKEAPDPLEGTSCSNCTVLQKNSAETKMQNCVF